MNCCGSGSNHNSEHNSKKEVGQTDSGRAAEAQNIGQSRSASKFFHLLHWIIMIGLVGYFIATSLKK